MSTYDLARRIVEIVVDYGRKPGQPALIWLIEAELAKSVSLPPEGGARWIPVADALADLRIQQVNPAHPIFAQDASGQWFRLDGLPTMNVVKPKEQE